MTFEQAAAIPQAAVLAPLTQALKGESLASPYFAAQLLAALGRSPAKLGIQSKGTLAQALYAALGQVVALPE